MPHITLIICTILSVVIAAVVLIKPLILQKPKPYFLPDSGSNEFDESLALLEMISELEMDYQAGKISKADFELMSLEYKREYLDQKDKSVKNRS